MPTAEVKQYGPEGLDHIQSLWESLNQLHADVSPHFGQDFESFTFASRKQHLKRKASLGALRIFLARHDDQPVGYCVVSLTGDQHGEIESIFVNKECRGAGIGDQLMRSALEWLGEAGAKTHSICVVNGNESAFSFYEKYGFYPRSTTLTLR